MTAVETLCQRWERALKSGASTKPTRQDYRNLHVLVRALRKAITEDAMGRHADLTPPSLAEDPFAKPKPGERRFMHFKTVPPQSMVLLTMRGGALIAGTTADPEAIHTAIRLPIREQSSATVQIEGATGTHTVRVSDIVALSVNN